MATVKVLGLDPGKTTGYALINVLSDRTIEPTSYFGNTRDMTLVDIKHIIELADYIIYEKWITFDKYARTGRLSNQGVPAEQVIGSLKTLLRLQTKKPVVHSVVSGVKPVSYGFAGMKYVPGKTGMHWQDAMAHACYYAVEKLNSLPVRHVQT